MKKEIWCTLGPSSLNDRVIGRLEEIGVSLFRLNLSHTKVEELPRKLEYIQKRTQVPVCLDTEGAQVRTASLQSGTIAVRENSTIYVHREPVAGDENNFNLYPDYIVNHLRIGDLIKVDAEALVQVVAIEKDRAILKVLNGGEIGQNKAVTVLEREIAMPAMTDKDQIAVEIGKQYGIKHVALSFANHAADVDQIRAAAPDGAMVISKIECLNGLKNLAEIVAKTDAVLIDRGDLSRQVNIEKIPALQKDIIRYCKENGCKVYVATNLMESMVTSPNPTRAEVNDVFNTLMDGADGLVLAAETAIGQYPISAAKMVHKLIREFESNFRWPRVHFSSASESLLVEPHGGSLSNKEVPDLSVDELGSLQRLQIKHTDIMDCVQIANGTYSPLTGFMSSEELKSVLQDNRLPDGLAWTMPVVLQADKASLARISTGDRVALVNETDKVHALLDVSEIYSFDFDEVTEKWFGTNSLEHPGVARLAAGGRYFVAGRVTLIEKAESVYAHYELSPMQTRQIFTQKGWSKVVGFHTRNVPHKAHEYIQLTALESVHADGLFISPVIGPKKDGDFLEGPILRAYQLLLDSNVYPVGKVVLGAFSTYSRYCGPREAIFTALCRKNMGCSHFVIGRDHTGVNGYYKDSQTRKLFETLDVGIEPIFFEKVGYDPKAQRHTEIASESILSISGTSVRTALLNNEALPGWVIRDVVQEMLRKDIADGVPVFYGHKAEIVEQPQAS